MKSTISYLAFCSLLLLASSCGFKKVIARPSDSLSQPPTSIYDFEMNSINGEAIDFNIYKGKKLLIVNTASECGYTPQYADLQKLNDLYGDKIVILGFPANNFGGQEPGLDSEIAAFCEENYAVTFQMFSKVSVKGSDMDPLYQWLTDKTKNGWNEKAPNWNFCKYLINEDGELVKFYASGINPMGEEILGDIL